MRKTFRFVLLCLFWTFIAIVTDGHNCLAANTESNEVRVGYIDYHGFVDKQLDGTYSGYCADYLAKIAQHTGYHYTYVYGEWPELMQKLKKGEIDLLCNAQYTKERAAEYEYSKFPIGYTQGLLYTRQDNPDLCYEDFHSFNGKKVGIIKNSAMKSMFLKYCKENNFSCKLSEYTNEDTLVKALSNGKLDAICSEHLANHTGLSLLAKFGSDAFYIISYKNNPFINRINHALQLIKTDEDFETNLFHKYYDSSTAETSLKFTVTEKKYIENSGIIRVGLNQARPPFSSYDAQKKTFTGIYVDVLKEIERDSGLKFQLIPQPLGMTTPELLASDKFDIICGVERDNFTSNEKIESTDDFLESAIVPVGRAGVKLDLTKKMKASVPSSFQALQKKLKSSYPNLELVYYPTNRECLNALKHGKVDLYIQNTHILSSLLQEPQYDQLAILPVEIMTEHTAMAMRRNSDPTLRAILNKCIQGLDGTFVSSSLISHTFGSPYRYTVMDFIYKFRAEIILSVFLVLICIGLLARVAVVRRHGEEKLRWKNEQLAQALSQADRASVAKTRFLSQISHEIRTPMNAIVGLTEIAKDHKEQVDGKKLDEYLEKIDISSKVLLNIINDALDMSMLESKKLKISHKQFDMIEVLKSIRIVYEPQCEKKGVNLNVTSDCAEAYIGDSLRLNQVLLNLISNAYKFTDEGGTIDVTVTEKTKKDTNAFVRFTVKDTGCGMTEDMLQRLFQPFEQETSDTARKHGGSGLGMSITKNLVDLMHGAIHVTSEKDKGTTFVVDIPFEQVVESDEKLEKEKSGDESKARKYDFTGHKVLLAEDQELNAEIATEFLHAVNMEVDYASDGQKAFEMFEQAPPNTYDLILMDVQMPVMNGYESAKAIRSLERPDASSILIYAMTANSFAEDIATALSVGMNGHLSKPIDTKALYKTLFEAIYGNK